jgi:hypothetical protein
MLIFTSVITKTNIMRALFENGKISEIQVMDYVITMDSFKRFVVRKVNSGYLILESSNEATWEWVRDYCMEMSNKQWTS